MLGITFGDKHSYNDWGLFLEDTKVTPPLPKRYLVDVPARNGTLDLTAELTPIMRYQTRQLQFKFRVKAGDWSTLLSQIYGDVHGRTLDIISDLDPDWHWHGFVTVNDFSSDKRTGVLVINADVDPYKLANIETAYAVSGNGSINCYVERMEVTPSFETTAPTTVKYGDISAAITSSRTKSVTTSGSLLSIVDGTANSATSLVSDIVAVQSGSGDPAPDNIRPISGWTGANVFHTKENLMGGNLLRDGIQNAIPSANNNPTDRKISFKSNDVVNQAITDGILTGKFKENTRYTFIFKIYKNTGSSSNIRINYTDGTYSTITGYYGTQTRTVATVSASGKTVQSLSKINGSGTSTLFYDESGIFEGVYTVDDFIPYEGITYTTTWTSQGTVYGGTWNPVTGVLTKTWDYIASYNGEELPAEWKSDRDVYASGTTPTTGAEVIYELATPVTYQLAAQQVIIFLNENNIWSDTGDTTLTYLAQDFADQKFQVSSIEMTEGNNTLTIESTGTTTVTYTNGRL